MGRAALPPTVLIVEDEALISRLVADWLNDHGFFVHEAASGDEALAYIDRGGPVDAMFTDVNLPGSIDGAELAARVRARRPELPIVYASGRYTSDEIAPLVPRSVFVAKPYDPADVCTLLERLTGGRR
ncbi:MAG TPA: response regulator [Pseudolabrys sp.]|nr:response regulator [Pseudolabrys sp.]